MRRLLLRLAMLALGLMVGTMFAELALRLSLPAKFTLGGETMNFAAGTLSSFAADPEVGYLPRLNSPEYDADGCLRNSYPRQKVPGRLRVLFIGDSVTHRGQIVKALRELYGESLEYWNAGVEGFNTAQEVELFLRHNHRIQPDHVVLTFHPNDFLPTPLVYNDAQGHMQLLIPHRERKAMNPWLFSRSHLYRLLLGLTWKRGQGQRVEEVRAQLQRLQSDLDARGVQLSVLMLPYIKPYRRWDRAERWNHAQGLALLKELKLRTFDLAPLMEQRAAAGGEHGESPGDAWHPNLETARAFAKKLKQEGLLDPRGSLKRE